MDRSERRVSSAVAALLLSVLVHAVAVTLALILNPPLEPPPKPIPVKLLPPPPPPPAEEPPPARTLEFRAPQPLRPREALRLAPEKLDLKALVPPPPDVVVEADAMAGGLAVDVVGPSALGGFTLGGEGGGRSGFGVGSGNGTGAGRGSFAEYVGTMRQVGLDVVFVVDATGSMGWLIEEVRDRIDGLASAIRRLVPVTRFGIVAYRDDDDPEFVTRVEPLTLSTLRARRFLETLEARGGGDIPEAVDAGLETAMERAGWKAEAKHVIVVLGDAPPHPERMERTLALARAFHARGGTVTTVDVSFDANPRIAAARLGKRVDELTTVSPRGVLPEFREIAEAGGGDASTLEGDRRAIRQIGVLIFGERWAEQVRPLLGEL